MKPGDVVTLVHGLPPTPTEPVTFVRLVDGHGRALVRTTSGGEITVPSSLLDDGQPPSRGPGYRMTDPETSRWAAEQTAHSLRDSQFAVLDALVRAGDRGLMDCEHEALIDSRPDSAGKRRLELQMLGLVANAGFKRETPRKRLAFVWVATARGRAVWQHHQQDGAA